MPEEDISAGSEAGASGEAGGQQDASLPSQDGGRGQTSESGKVDAGGIPASSGKDRARSNFNWSNQRLMEKAASKAVSSVLKAELSPLIEKLNSVVQPPVESRTTESQIDYNDLTGSIQRLVAAAVTQELKGVLSETLPALRQNLLGDLSVQSNRQDAKKYLLSQKDIGNDLSKHDEIKDIIIEDEILSSAIDKYPVKVMQEAVRRWRSGKVNPNAPGLEELSTVTGGMGAERRGLEPNIQKIRDLADKLIDPSLTIDDRDKLNREYETLMKTFK